MTSVLIPAVGPEDHVRGPADATLTLVEYGDYECSDCGLAHVVLQQVLEELGDRVRFVYRNFPNPAIHPDARAAAEAAESVASRGGEDAFWRMHDLLYENQDALQHDDLIEYAAAVGVDPIEVADDLTLGLMRKRIERDIVSGMQSVVRRTPTFFVNGRRFEGDWTDPGALTDALQDDKRGWSYTTH